VGKQVPFGRLRAGSHRAYRPIRNGIDILLLAPRRFYEMLLKSPDVLGFWFLVFLGSVLFSEAGRRDGWESRFPSAGSGQALTGRTARFGMTSIFCFQSWVFLVLVLMEANS